MEICVLSLKDILMIMHLHTNCGFIGFWASNRDSRFINMTATKDGKDAEKQKNGKADEMATSHKTSYFLMGFGAFGVLLGALMVVFWPPLFLSQLQRMMTLSPTSTSYGIWKDIPIPMYMECFLLNITNVDEILAGQNVSIKVAQMGPYVFRETSSKVDLEWNDNSTVTYYNERWWHYVPEMSNGSLSDMVTSINPITATIAYIVRFQPRWIRFAVDSLVRMYHEHFFITANVSDWLFDGIDDPVLEVVGHIPDFPINIPYEKFAWFYDRNGSREYDGVFVMNTGAADFSRLGNMELWRHSNRTVFRDECGEVRGSTGELWAPEFGQPELEVFVPDICTYLVVVKNRTVVHEYIEGVEYNADASFFDNGHNYPSRACYCDEVRDENCLPPGALNVSACRYGAPAFVSLPHFLNMDPYYPSKIEGLEPTDEHNFRLALEMFTGMPLAVSAQMQINMLVRHVSAISINNQLPDPDTLVPMFWFRQEVRLTPEYARLARFALNMRYGVPYGLYALTAIGVVLLSAGIIILVRKLMHSPDTTPILEESPETSQSEPPATVSARN